MEESFLGGSTFLTIGAIQPILNYTAAHGHNPEPERGIRLEYNQRLMQGGKNGGFLKLVI